LSESGSLRTINIGAESNTIVRQPVWSKQTGDAEAKYTKVEPNLSVCGLNIDHVYLAFSLVKHTLNML
jgi:hypothetical protein